jgi:hypothetical protein
MTDFDAPFDADNTDGLAAEEIAAMNAEFRRLWPQWRIRAPKRLSDEQVTRTLCHHVARKYLGG